MFYERADPAHGFDKGAGLRSGRSKPQIKIWVGLCSRDRRRSSEVPQAGISDPIFVFGSGEWRDTLSMAALVDLKPQKSAWAFDLVAWWGFLDAVFA